MKYIGLFDEKEDIVTKEKLETKQDIITGAATTITNDNLTVSRALVSDASGKVAVSPVTSTELGYLDGVTSNVQTQLDSKQGINDEIQGLRLRGGISSIGSMAASVAINPSVNGAGFARLAGATVKIYYDDYEMPMSNSEIDSLFDGRLGTYINFPQPVGDFVWQSTKTYPTGAYVTDQTHIKWYKALKENTNVPPVDDTTGTWEFVSRAQSGTYANRINLDNVTIYIDITFLSSIRYENSLALYWRTTGQNAPYVKVEKYDSNAGWFQVYEKSNIGSDEIINNIYIAQDPSGAGTQKRLRITLKPRTGTNWFALSQIAITGLYGGIEGTLVNRGGSTMYGNLSPYTSGGASLGTTSAPWNEVRANKLYGDGSNLTNIPYPVTSVNTKTGAVTLSASDVGAQPTITVNGIIKGDGAGNLSAQDTVTAELVDLPTVPTKVSELENDANYITAAQAPVQSVNNKTGAVSLTASDVSAIPSTLTGAAGQVLTKTADGQEWKDATPRDIYFDVNGVLQNQDLQLLDSGTFSDLTSQWNQLAITGSGNFRNVDIPMPCIDAQFNADSENTIILRYAGIGVTEEQAIFTGIYYNAGDVLQYSVSLVYQLGEQGFQQYNIIPVRNVAPSTTTPLAPTEAGAVGTSTAYARGDHSHPKEVFVCTVTGDVMSEDYSCDKTYAEIVAAYNAGKICIAKYGGIVFQLANVKLAGLGTKYVIFKSSVASSSTSSGSSGVVVLTITSTNTVTVKDEIVSKLPNATKITLTVAGWDSTAKTQSVAVSGVLADATKQEIRVMPVNATLDSPYIAAGVQCVAQAADSLTFACETVPTEAIEVYVVMQNISYSA